MKERLVTLGFALCALALFYALFVPKGPGVGDAVAKPLSTEIQEEGYQALWRWLQAQGVRVVSLRDRYDRLEKQGVPDAGNVMITILPHQLPARPGEAAQLDSWLARGNTLLVLAALDDTPAWAVRSGSNIHMELQRMTGLAIEAIKEKPAADGEAAEEGRRKSVRETLQLLLQPHRSSIIAKGSHPLFAGVQSVATESPYPASRWKAHSADGTAVLELGKRIDEANAGVADSAVWLKRHGQGQIIVLGFASPFSNALIGKADNARLFSNVVAWSRAGQGAVLFDDAHQGLVSYYDPKAFFADSRLHRSLLWLGALWLLFVLGWQRLRPHVDGWKPADVTTFIKVTGGFIAGRVAPNMVGQRLCENFFNRVRRQLSMPQNGQPVWDWLAARAAIAAPDLEDLRRLHARTQTRQRINLIQLQNCLTRITGSLT